MWKGDYFVDDFENHQAVNISLGSCWTIPTCQYNCKTHCFCRNCFTHSCEMWANLCIFFYFFLCKNQKDFCFVCFILFCDWEQTSISQNKYIIKIFPTFLPIFLEPFQLKAFVSMWGQHWPFHSVYVMASKTNPWSGRTWSGWSCLKKFSAALPCAPSHHLCSHRHLGAVTGFTGRHKGSGTVPVA